MIVRVSVVLTGTVVGDSHPDDHTIQTTDHGSWVQTIHNVQITHLKTNSNLKVVLLYSWHLSRFSAPIHWLVYGHMTCNNATFSCQMP